MNVHYYLAEEFKELGEEKSDADLAIKIANKLNEKIVDKKEKLKASCSTILQNGTGRNNIVIRVNAGSGWISVSPNASQGIKELIAKDHWFVNLTESVDDLLINYCLAERIKEIAEDRSDVNLAVIIANKLNESINEEKDKLDPCKSVIMQKDADEEYIAISVDARSGSIKVFPKASDKVKKIIKKHSWFIKNRE